DIEDEAGRETNRLLDKDFEKKLETLEGLQEKMEIIRMPPSPAGLSPKMELSLEEAAKLGIEAKMGHENGYFVYELKVPLIKSSEHLYAIEAKKGEPIGLGLEVLEYFNPKISDNAMPNEVRMPEARESMLGSPDKLKLWFIVTLSSNAT
ncbi:MAG: hypothetical protein NTW13_02670, partial [Candidatus Omnitrophica bacterium]|nr:hypothetical protein [Candidatus Omnitrophota bacterium]